MPENVAVNPILTFKRTPAPKGITGGGKNANGIKSSLLSQQRSYLSSKLKEISQSSISEVTFAGKTHLIAKMQDDSHSPSWTPNDLFCKEYNCEIISPAYEGFLIEASTDAIDKLAAWITVSQKTRELVDISRVKSVDLFGREETLRGRNASDLWGDDDPNSHKVFNFWLKPFKHREAREALSTTFKKKILETECRLGDPEFDTPSSQAASKDGLEAVLDDYCQKGIASLSLEVANKEALERLLASGAIYRIEPSTPLTTTCKAGEGQEPAPKAVSRDSPVVVIIDGGVSASSYIPLQRISLQPLVNDCLANKAHGNKVTSLVCHAHAWNNNRPLPKLDCTFISAQAICKENAQKSPTNSQLISYLESVAEQTAGHANVWNLSFNQIVNKIKEPEVSYLGHEISKISRKYGILPVISIGNLNHNSVNKVLCPPADCESALTISGREYESDEAPLGSASSFSLRGPGPAGMKKPDLSWYGTLRMIGGSEDHGTSFSTPLVSSLAAHAFSNIKSATPDLVRALLINKADLQEHNPSLGWGTPFSDENLPWHCPAGTVTLTWVSELKPGYDYYWNDIPVPEELFEKGKFRGTVILTAILEPLVSEAGGQNYFATRLQTSLQAKSQTGATIPLAGSMKESKEKELLARDELSKWSPVRHHAQTHQGKTIQPDSVRLYARVFARDLYQFDVEHHSELGKQNVAFVLTFKAANSKPSLYDTMVSRLGSDVESALISQEVEVTNEADL